MDRLESLIKLEHYAATVRDQGFPIGFAEIREIYDLNNYFLPHQFESSIGCGSCQHRVKTRIFGWFDSEGRAELEQLRNTNKE